MEAVEVVKENMQPRRGGRAAATLPAAETGPEHAARVQAERRCGRGPSRGLAPPGA